MTDFSHLDKKYFLDRYVYNCPFCNRRNVAFTLIGVQYFDWSNTKRCYLYLVSCDSCQKTSMHLSYTNILNEYSTQNDLKFKEDVDIDSNFFYSVPTSFFVLDDRIPKNLRELITEAEGCLKMNLLTGASACMRKSIYELLILEKCSGINYDEQIKQLKTKYKDTDPSLFDILAHIKDMTSDKVHEQSWDKWDSKSINLIIEALKAVLYDIFVIPAIKLERAKNVMQLREEVNKPKK